VSAYQKREVRLRGGREQIASVHPLRIVHEDEDVLVVFKPAGLLTATTERERRATALKLVREYVERSSPRGRGRGRGRVGLIHRLDREASGLLVFSKNDRAYRSLKGQFFHHTVERVYEALVRGTPEPAAGRIESKLVEYADGTVHSTTHPKHGQVAITDYETIRSEPGGRTWVRVRLHTGRKHQIRAHLSERGWPIVGDRVYGGGVTSGGGGGPLRLRAVRLSIDHPRTGERMVFDLGRVAS
jgi:RluA family pseudouridine synthase